MRILRADNGVGPTGKEVREDERFQRKLDKEQRLLGKFAGKQARRTGMSETEALLEALNNPEQFEAFKERRQILAQTKINVRTQQKLRTESGAVHLFFASAHKIKRKPQKTKPTILFLFILL